MSRFRCEKCGDIQIKFESVTCRRCSVPMYSEYELALINIAEAVHQVHPIGRVTSIGLLNVKAACREMFAELVAFRAIVPELESDAKRYRWLRKNCTPTLHENEDGETGVLELTIPAQGTFRDVPEMVDEIIFGTTMGHGTGAESRIPSTSSATSDRWSLSRPTRSG